MKCHKTDERHCQILKALYNDGFNSWFTFIKTILKLLNVSVSFDKLSDMSLKSLKKICKKTILEKYKQFWEDYQIKNIDGKLRTYFTFKFHFEFEQYLSIIKNFDKRSSITKLRISSHRLQIERGRYFRPPIDVEKKSL